MKLPLWLRVAESLAVVATPVLIAVGGFFAWYKFIRRGEHDPRLQPSVAGRAVVRGGTIHVVAAAVVQNTGKVDVDLREGVSAVEIYATKAGGHSWQYVAIAPVFEEHEIVQPGETIEDQFWLELRHEERVGVKLDLTVAPSEDRSYPKTEIISLLSED